MSTSFGAAYARRATYEEPLELLRLRWMDAEAHAERLRGVFGERLQQAMRNYGATEQGGLEQAEAGGLGEQGRTAAAFAGGAVDNREEQTDMDQEGGEGTG